jgi:hypothetical protein
MAEIRMQIRGLMTQADALQAQCEGLELDLGLANEGEQAARDQCMILHYLKGDDTGHPLDECTDACIAEESLNVLGEGGVEEVEGADHTEDKTPTD